MALESCSHGNPGMNFFQEHISPIDGNRCSSYPSCSQYSNTAFKKHGAVMGWIMACDRLVRCGRDTATLSKKVVINSEVFAFDPVEANDFWWYEEKVE
ncbi:MAG: membrane protein insertion efficiency factor YidD [Desulfobacteraceae bacterium]|nr:membrane protein insertion efficiency factor YidD [Desulfobacteraceae bacterium]